MPYTYWIGIANPICLTCKDTVSVSANPDFTEFIGKCSCGHFDLTSDVLDSKRRMTEIPDERLPDWYRNANPER